MNSNALINYYLYQPACLVLEPVVVKHRVHPHAITGARALVVVAVAACIAASAVDAESPRRWVWVLCAFAGALFAGVTDDLDGYIARKYDLASKAGERADGVADVGGWILAWLTMLYFFGWRRVLLPVALWLCVGAWACSQPRTLGKQKMKCAMMDATLLPLLVALFYACYPPG